MKFQVRSEKTGIQEFDTFKEAMQAALDNNSIWKVSFTISETGEQVRLVYDDNANRFFYEPISFRGGVK